MSVISCLVSCFVWTFLIHPAELSVFCFFLEVFISFIKSWFVLLPSSFSFDSQNVGSHNYNPYCINVNIFREREMFYIFKKYRFDSDTFFPKKGKKALKKCRLRVFPFVSQHRSEVSHSMWQAQLWLNSGRNNPVNILLLDFFCWIAPVTALHDKHVSALLRPKREFFFQRQIETRQSPPPPVFLESSKEQRIHRRQRNTIPAEV